ncbi:MAG: hypothetical protein M1814_001471 [Vezdaea aestivalis]|nr:MAG: hypothetical protein M1814_001471 [Vezdaea aestivalis]
MDVHPGIQRNHTAPNAVSQTGTTRSSPLYKVQSQSATQHVSLPHNTSLPGLAGANGFPRSNNILPLAATGPVAASDNIINQQADSSRSLFQICTLLRKRLALVPGLEYYIDEVDRIGGDGITDIVTSLWTWFRRGVPLLTLYNAMHPAERLEAKEGLSNEKIAQDAAYKFINACNKQLKIPSDECFVLRDLTGDDTAGFVKVTRVVNRVLDILQAGNFLYDHQEDKSAENTGPETTMTRRDHIIKELLTTEQKYVQDLEALQQFKRQVQEKGIISGDTIHAIFLNLDALLDFQRRFLIRIEWMNTQKGEQQNWGQLFVQNKDAFMVYEPYIANQKLCEETAMREYDRLATVGSGVTADRTTLSAFLLKPFQRLTKYPLILKVPILVQPQELSTYTVQDLAKTETKERDQRDLASALLVATSILDNTNELANEKLRQQAADELKEHVGQWKNYNIDKWGPLLLNGDFTILKHDGKAEVEKEVSYRLSPYVTQDMLDPASGNYLDFKEAMKRDVLKVVGTVNGSGEVVEHKFADQIASKGKGKMPALTIDIPPPPQTRFDRYSDGSSSSPGLRSPLMSPVAFEFQEGMSLPPTPLEVDNIVDPFMAEARRALTNLIVQSPPTGKSPRPRPRPELAPLRIEKPRDRPYLDVRTSTVGWLPTDSFSLKAGMGMNPFVCNREDGSAISLPRNGLPSEGLVSLSEESSSSTGSNTPTRSSFDPRRVSLPTPSSGHAERSWITVSSSTLPCTEDDQDNYPSLPPPPRTAPSLTNASSNLTESSVQSQRSSGSSRWRKTFLAPLTPGRPAPSEDQQTTESSRWDIPNGSTLFISLFNQNVFAEEFVKKRLANCKAAKSPRFKQYKVYLFRNILICVKDQTMKTKSKSIVKVDKKKPTKFALKGRIYMSNVTDVLYLSTPSERSYVIQIFWTADKGIENFMIRFPSEEMMKKWYKVLEKQQKLFLRDGTDSSENLRSTTTNGDEFTWVHQNEQPKNQYQEEHDDDDAEGSNFYNGGSEFNMSRNASSTSLRSRSTTGESGPPSKLGSGRYPPNHTHPPLSLHTQVPTHANNAMSPTDRAGQSFFSPAAETPMSTRTNGPTQVNYPFPRQMTPNNGWPEEHNRYTAPAGPRSGSRDGSHPYNYTNGRSAQRPSLPPNAHHTSQQAAYNQRSRSASSPSITLQNQSQIPDVPIPPFPPHLVQVPNRSENNSPTNPPIILPARSTTQSPGLQRTRMIPHDYHHSRSQNSTPVGGYDDRRVHPSQQSRVLPMHEPPSPTQLKVKVSFDNHTVSLVAGMNITYQTLADRIDAKIGRVQDASIGSGSMRLRYRDDEGDFVTITSDEDIHMAFSEWKEQQKSKPQRGSMEEIHLFCQKTD